MKRFSIAREKFIRSRLGVSEVIAKQMGSGRGMVGGVVRGAMMRIHHEERGEKIDGLRRKAVG